MAITASIRVSGLKFRGTFDVVWLFLWQQIEACVAVTMLSLTAFRSAFVASASARVQRESPNTPWYSSTVEAIKRNRALRRHDEESSQGLPQIPSATLTGLRTFIRGEQDTTTSSLSNDRTPIYEMGAEKGPFHKDKYKSNHEKNPLQGH